MLRAKADTTANPVIRKPGGKSKPMVSINRSAQMPDFLLTHYDWLHSLGCAVALELPQPLSSYLEVSNER
jgi:hypothetical protein